MPSSLVFRSPIETRLGHTTDDAAAARSRRVIRQQLLLLPMPFAVRVAGVTESDAIFLVGECLLSIDTCDPSPSLKKTLTGSKFPIQDDSSRNRAAPKCKLALYRRGGKAGVMWHWFRINFLMKKGKKEMDSWIQSFMLGWWGEKHGPAEPSGPTFFPELLPAKAMGFAENYP
jgi:hypothetical protein